jgi:ZIP family zinc transporter
MAAVGLGLLLGLGSAGGSALVGPLRTFAFTAALGVAVTHLLPEALGALGAPGLLLFAAASVAPAWVGIARELVGFKARAGHGHAVLGAGYAGLLVHHVGDGLGLGAYSVLPGGPLAHADVLAALAVHTVPLVAVVTLAFRAQRGVRAAVERALGLAGASVGGVLLSGSVPSAFTDSLSAWIAAAVAGLLLHVVTHDLGRDLPATTSARAVDWLAAALGILTSALGADPDLVALRHAMLDEFVNGAICAAPGLVLGLATLLAAARSSKRAAVAPRWFDVPVGALDGAFFGAILASVRFGILLGLGTTLLAKFSEWFAGHRLEHAPHEAHGHHADSTHDHAADAGPAARETTTTTAALVRECVAWTLTGLVLYALIGAALGADALARLGRPVALAGAAFCGLALDLPPVAAVLIAAATWRHGLAPEAALAFAVMATARPPTRLLLLVATLIGGLSVGCSNAGSHFAPVHLPRELGLALLSIPLAATGFAAWQHGIRGLFAAVFHSHDSA